MPDFVGAFRVTKNAFVNTHYAVLLLKDSLVFIKTSSEFSGHDVHPLMEKDLQRFSNMSKEELVLLNKKNFIVNFDEIISLDLKKSSFGLNGPKTGQLTIKGKTISKFEISPMQNFEAILSMVRSALPGKLDPMNLAGQANPLLDSTEKVQFTSSELRQSNTADTATELSRDERKIRNGSYWIFVIAGLSVVNFIVFLLGSNINFLIGLAFTQFLAAFTRVLGGDIKVWAVIITLIVVAIFVICGFFARKGISWAFITAIVIYVIDTCLFFIVKDWLSIVFHILAVYFIIMGARSSFKLGKNKTNRISL
jgi:hypothetical protein